MTTEKIKKRKKKCKKGHDEQEKEKSFSSDVLPQECAVDNVSVEPPRKKKKKNKISQTDKLSVHADTENRDENLGKKSKKRKKDKKKVEEASSMSEENVAPQTEIKKAKKAKKKKKETPTSEVKCKGTGTLGIVDVPVTKKSKKNRKSEEIVINDVEKSAVDSVHNMVKKSKKSKVNSNIETLAAEISGKKKDKKHNDTSEILDTCDTESSKKKKKNKKEKKRKLEASINDTDESKKIKIGSNDENVKNPVNKSEESSNFGQWGQVTLGSEDRTNKFLKLMGGYKSKSHAISDSGAVSGNAFKKPNKFVNPNSPFLARNRKAMSEQEQENLNKKLEDQFQKAFDLKLYAEKGGGLGYAPPPGAGKKFHIDINSSKSMKFD
ncbi:uncharacterized protein LOC141905838 isoform X2 [Tubulanus polymorphus]